MTAASPQPGRLPGRGEDTSRFPGRPDGSGTYVAPPPSATAPVRRGPRRARLLVKRVDPWSVLKLTFVYSCAIYVIILIAVTALFALLSGMGVFHALNTFLHDVGASQTWLNYLHFGRIFLITLILGAINIVLLTALGTLGAFLYNLCSDIVGGVEVTLTETE